ncbi:ComEA family DNA-binding protein [Actinomadura atramentaria]|uniref:ComEA family DNA-binding protein n=1 Tax=Actinomadura atramentaria TaxID=1990 RepID=UPI001F0ADFAD|nr:ComEA family DNA-binding protein [Actinomadura atramentaria]
MLVSAGVLAVLVALLFLWLARPRTAADPTPGRDAPAAALVSGPGASAPVGPATPSSSGSTVLVHVLGKVRHPGVVTLPAGARVADALRAAGGPRPGAGTGPLNLARPVVDGEQIPVGVPGASPIPPPAPGAVPGSGPAGGTDSAPIDLNTATSDDLQRLPGVGPVLAERILAYRTQHGGFRSVDQLREVSGIGERRFADLRQRVRT